MQTEIDPPSLIGRRAFDRNGARIGTVDEVYLDDVTGLPEWAAVRTGLFGRDAFVPLKPSSLDGEHLRVPYDRALIRSAPDFGVGRHLSPAQELQLYHHYGMDLPASPRERDTRDRQFGHVAGEEPTTGAQVPDPEAAGRSSAPAGDDSGPSRKGRVSPDE